MKELLPFIKMLWNHRDWAVWGIIFGALTLLSSIGLLAVSGWFISASAIAGLSLVTLQHFNIFTPSASIRGFAVSRTAGRYIERLLSHEATLRLLAALRVWFYQRIEPQAPAGLLRHRSGDLLNRIVSDIDTLDSLFIRVLSPSISASLVAMVVGGFLWWLAPSISIAFLLFYLAAGVLIPLLTRRLGQTAGGAILRHTTQLRTSFVEDLRGMADLTLYGAIERRRIGHLEENLRLLSRQKTMAHISGVGTALMSLLAGLAAISALYIAIPMAQSGAFDSALPTLITFGVLAAFEAVLPLPQAYQMLGKIRTAARRLLEIGNAPAAVSFPVVATTSPADTTVSYQQIDFTYPGSDAKILDGFDLLLPSHATTALVGASGCGKTTIAHLLTRFWDPDQGLIRIGGQHLSSFNEQQLREMVTLVSQKSHIFNATLRDNLLIADPQATIERLWDALERAQLADFVAKLPDGLETWMKEGGTRLSGGEARRLILARALLRNSPIWILDEPTEGLDNATRQQFLKTLFDNLTGKSALLITHTRDALERVDQVCFMKNGRVHSHGRHQDLLIKCGQYRQFIEQ